MSTGHSRAHYHDLFCLLDGDKNAFAKLLREYRVKEPIRALKDVPPAVWQNYVRETHAARSAQRVRAFFLAIDPNLGDTIALVSEAHYMDFEPLRAFDTALPLQGELVNVRAMALYLRLIDLFDLAGDRTPYALWKFVSPDTAKSAEEWQKHRALSPVVIEVFQGTGRCLRVSGITDDHRVYAALEDLREYCESQLRISNGLLNELDSRYQPRLLLVNWKVEAKGFEPISVRFEFDRQAMMKVLSDEIYQGDRYVFLRELLQNSIDAIRLRRELHKVKKTGASFNGEIHVTVEHLDNGHAVVTWKDNGCGMSAFIVRNYLTVAGKSFYRSEDFHKLGVRMDPISRYGIGILSCFMVAERIEILTRQDPQIEATAEALKIEIHNPTRHLRIQRCAPEDLPFGTTVSVFIGNQITAREEKTPASRLDVTGYLKDVAGFVEFPIYVKEGVTKTLILNPQTAKAVNETDSWHVTALDCSFAWQDFLAPQDVHSGQKYFNESRLAVKLSARNQLFEGVISSPVLKEGLELREGYGGLDNEDVHFVVRGNEEIGRIRIQARELSERAPLKSVLSRECDNMCRVYCDGILVPGVSMPSWVGGWNHASTYRIVLNINSASGIKLDLSRHNIASEELDWSGYVRRRCVNAFRRKAKQIVDDQLPTSAFYQLCRLIAYGSGFVFYREIEELIADIPIPLVVLGEKGDLAVIPSRKLEGCAVHVVPTGLARGLSRKIFEGWASMKWLEKKSKAVPWNGSLCIFGAGMSFGYMLGKGVESIRDAERVQECWLRAARTLKSVRFLFPGKNGMTPLRQEVWFEKKGQKIVPFKKRHRGLMLASETVAKLSKISSDLGYNTPNFVEFCDPFSEFFTAGWQYINVLHPVTQGLVDCINAVADHEAAGTIAGHDLGRIRDCLEPLFGRDPGYDYLPTSKAQDKLDAASQLFKVTSELGIFEPAADCSLPKEMINVPAVKKGGRLGAPIMSLKDVGL